MFYLKKICYLLFFIISEHKFLLLNFIGFFGLIFVLLSTNNKIITSIQVSNIQNTFFQSELWTIPEYSEIKVCTNIFFLTDSNHKWTFGLPRFKKWIQWQKLRATYWSRVSTSHTRSNSTIPKNIFQRRAVNQPIARFTSKIWTQCCEYTYFQKIHKYTQDSI